jgi:hypothetical protein
MYTVGRSLLQLESMCKKEVLNVWNHANVRNHSTFVSNVMVRSHSTHGCTEMVLSSPHYRGNYSNRHYKI